MTAFIAQRVVLFAIMRLTCDLVCEELLILENGVERKPTEQELHDIANGFKLMILGKGTIT